MSHPCIAPASHKDGTMTRATLTNRVDRLVARRRPALVIEKVVIGPDEPRRPGEILLGGNPDPARPGVTLVVHYVAGEISNPQPADVDPPPVASAPAAEVQRAPWLDPNSRIGRAYARDVERR